jgi:peptide-methionine (R)-S-oxide reductase
MPYEVSKTDAEWQRDLSPEEFHVLRRAGTEPPGSSPLEALDDRSYVYACRACGADLFRSETKFDAHCGWPSFYAPLAEDRVEYHDDHSLGMARTEVRCARCGSHLGHVFTGEGFTTPTDQRYCINGVALRRTEEDGADNVDT